jgi:hypothetical protein
VLPHLGQQGEPLREGVLEVPPDRVLGLLHFFTCAVVGGICRYQQLFQVYGLETVCLPLKLGFALLCIKIPLVCVLFKIVDGVFDHRLHLLMLRTFLHLFHNTVQSKH